MRFIFSFSMMTILASSAFSAEYPKGSVLRIDQAKIFSVSVQAICEEYVEAKGQFYPGASVVIEVSSKNTLVKKEWSTYTDGNGKARYVIRPTCEDAKKYALEHKATLKLTSDFAFLLNSIRSGDVSLAKTDNTVYCTKPVVDVLLGDSGEILSWQRVDRVVACP